jgi:hypothetical protein
VFKHCLNTFWTLKYGVFERISPLFSGTIIAIYRTMAKINVTGKDITVIQVEDSDYISLTDMARIFVQP